MSTTAQPTPLPDATFCLENYLLSGFSRLYIPRQQWTCPGVVTASWLHLLTEGGAKS